jgi:hypothetical protein
MKKFTRKIEDFKCEYCGFNVFGNGYTNHCPKCLYSKHVDVNPGDRQNICQGLMKPIGLEMEHGEQIINHKCLNCGFERKNKTEPQDQLEILYS